MLVDMQIMNIHFESFKKQVILGFDHEF